MAKICKWCGNKIQFMDVGFDLIEIDNEDYYICSQCNANISDFKKGNVTLDKIATADTDKKLYEYMEQFTPDIEIFKENEKQREQEQAIQTERQQAQETNPLYDDIHQIAGDLRFIKNLIIVGLVITFIFGLVIGFQMI